MGYLSCRANTSIATCRSIASFSPSPSPKNHNSFDPSDTVAGGGAATQVSDARFRVFTYPELESATGSFSEDALLGRGSHGAVYKAVLRDRSRPVAVKRPSRRPSSHLVSPTSSAASTPAARDEVENEIAVLSTIRSPRLVNLVGFTPPEPGRRERLLVLEYMPNGTLYDLLHSNPRPPGWARRLRLALQTSKGLLALHSARPPVIHRDVKSANILIDRDFNARLGDFGLAFCQHGEDDQCSKLPLSARSTPPPAGTLGYLDPAYVTPENLSTKTDVFSFGILLLEIMSGRKAIDVAHSPPFVVEWAVPLVRKGKILALFDPRILPPKDPAARRQLALLAASCVRSSKERRPSMEEVVQQLKVLSKTVPSRTWNVSNPCSVTDTEATLSKLNIASTNSDQSLSTTSKLNEVEEPAPVEEEFPVQMNKPPLPAKAPRPVSRNTIRVFSDVAMNSSRQNLINLMASVDGETNRRFTSDGNGSIGSTLTRTRTLRIVCENYDKKSTLQLKRNNSLRAVPSKEVAGAIVNLEKQKIM